MKDTFLNVCMTIYPSLTCYPYIDQSLEQRFDQILRRGITQMIKYDMVKHNPKDNNVINVCCNFKNVKTFKMFLI